MRTNTTSQLKAVIRPVHPVLGDNIAANLHLIQCYRRAIRRYYQARLSAGVLL